MEFFTASSEISISTLRIGAEGEPLVLVDNFLAQPDRLRQLAADRSSYTEDPGFYPGVRKPAPESFKHAILETLTPTIQETFGLAKREFRSIDSHFSVVTTPPDALELLQCLPHFDGTNRSELASIYYLCDREHGGTAFYRHRSTGFEYIDTNRHREYVSSLQSDLPKVNPKKRYMAGSNELYELALSVDAKFNRLVLYRGTSLHSGTIDPAILPGNGHDTPRLTIASFLHR